LSKNQSATAAARTEQQLAEWNGFPSTAPAPLPKRPKGSYFLGTAFLTVLLCAALAAWNAFFRYQAYGTVTGRVIEVPAAQGGIIRSIHVREGEMVRQGQVLATLENLDAKTQLDRLRDELEIAQATLDAEMTELSWQSRLLEDRTQRTLAEFHKLWGELLREEAKLANVQLQLKRKEEINRTIHRAISEEEIETLRFTEQGQRARVDKLKVAVEKLRKLASASGAEDEPQQLKPHVSRIKGLQAEMARSRERLELSEIRSPVNGRVLKTLFFTGEHAPSASPVVEILEQGSLEAVIYLPQRLARSYGKGDILQLHVVSSEQTLPVEVTRFGQQMETAPPALERYYRSNESLLKLHARPHTDGHDAGEDSLLRLGSEVRLPRTWTSWLRGSRNKNDTHEREITKQNADAAVWPMVCHAKPLDHSTLTNDSNLDSTRLITHEITLLPRSHE